MSSPIPHDLPPAIQGELIARLRDLDHQIEAIEGIFETLHLLADSFGLDTSDAWSIAYRVQIGTGRRYVTDAHMKARSIQSLFANTTDGAQNA